LGHLEWINSGYNPVNIFSVHFWKTERRQLKRDFFSPASLISNISCIISSFLFSMQYCCKIRVSFQYDENNVHLKKKEIWKEKYCRYGRTKRGGGVLNFETQHKWNAFEKLMIPSNWLHLINYESNKTMKKVGSIFLKKRVWKLKPPLWARSWLQDTLCLKQFT